MCEDNKWDEQKKKKKKLQDTRLEQGSSTAVRTPYGDRKKSRVPGARQHTEYQARVSIQYVRTSVDLGFVAGFARHLGANSVFYRESTH